MSKLRVFLAWSGPRSQAVAFALRDWLPSVIQNVEPWMSESEIDKGAMWSQEISSQLQDLRTGILCLTPENLRNPWINFEAGALSKLEGSHTLTYLLELDSADVAQPLGQFQHTKANKDDTRKLVETLNKKLGESGLPSTRLNETFDKWWGELDAALSKAKELKREESETRKTYDMLKEIVDTLRFHSGNHAKILNAVDLLLSERQPVGLSSLSTDTSGHVGPLPTRGPMLVDTLSKSIFPPNRADPRYYQTFQDTIIPPKE